MLTIGGRVRLSPEAGRNAQRFWGTRPGHITSINRLLNDHVEVGVCFGHAEYEPWFEADAWFEKYELEPCQLSIDKET